MYYDKSQLKKLRQLGDHASPAMEAFKAFDAVALADGAIPKKYKELIALGVALTTQCPYCLDIHKKKAIKAGATPEEISETVFVAAALRAGAAVVHGTHLLDDWSNQAALTTWVVGAVFISVRDERAWFFTKKIPASPTSILYYFAEKQTESDQAMLVQRNHSKEWKVFYRIKWSDGLSSKSAPFNCKWKCA